jgi:hypothetical protein
VFSDSRLKNVSQERRMQLKNSFIRFLRQSAGYQMMRTNNIP